MGPKRPISTHFGHFGPILGPKWLQKGLYKGLSAGSSAAKAPFGRNGCWSRHIALLGKAIWPILSNFGQIWPK